LLFAFSVIPSLHPQAWKSPFTKEIATWGIRPPPNGCFLQEVTPMKQVFKTEVYALFSIIAGFGGMALQSWMFSTVDNQGLLLRGHISEVLSYLLLAVVAAVSFLVLKNLKSDGEYAQLFPRSVVAAVGSFLAAAGILFSAFTPAAMGILRIAVRALGIIAGLALALGGCARFQGKRPNCLLYAAVAVFL
jgi:hypothetical protein